MILSAALAASILAGTGLVAADPSWRAQQDLSIVAVTSHFGKSDEPASGVVVGWKEPSLYVVTAAHVVEDIGRDLQADSVDVDLAPGLCGGGKDSAKVKDWQVLDRKGTLDAAVLTIELPARCAPNVRNLRHAPLSGIAVSGIMSQQQAAKLVVFGRDAGGGLATWQIIQKVTPSGDVIKVQTDVVQKEMSGGPVFTATGELVAIASARQDLTPPVAFLANYRAIRDRLRAARIDGQFAGDFAELDLRGYPPGSIVTVGVERPELLGGVKLVPPGDPWIEIVNSNGYQSASGTVHLESEKVTQKCVTLTQVGDRRFAIWRKPARNAGISLLIAGGLAGTFALYEHDQFQHMPSSNLRTHVNEADALADSAMILGALGIAAVLIGDRVWTPSEASSIHDCTQ